MKTTAITLVLLPIIQRIEMHILLQPAPAREPEPEYPLGTWFIENPRPQN